MNLFWVPGRNLLPEDKICFDEIQKVIDTATNDFLIRPDWDSNMACVDLMKASTSPFVFNESMMYLRRKLTSNNPKTSLLTLRLLETLMNNCGDRFYKAVNEKNFIYDLGKTTRKYCSKPGIEFKETAEVALDVVQAWGEAFLTKRQRYPNITDLYFELRKDGLPFKKVQFDSTRVPIFNDSFVALSGPNVNNQRSTNSKSTSNRKFSINETKPSSSNESPRTSSSPSSHREVSDPTDSLPELSISEIMSALSSSLSSSSAIPQKAVDPFGGNSLVMSSTQPAPPVPVVVRPLQPPPAAMMRIPPPQPLQAQPVYQQQQPQYMQQPSQQQLYYQPQQQQFPPQQPHMQMSYGPAMGAAPIMQYAMPPQQGFTNPSYPIQKGPTVNEDIFGFGFPSSQPLQPTQATLPMMSWNQSAPSNAAAHSINNTSTNNNPFDL